MSLSIQTYYQNLAFRALELVETEDFPLAAETILEIFAHLSGKQLLRASLVCKRWRVLAVYDLCKRRDIWHMHATAEYPQSVFFNAVFLQAEKKNNFPLALELAPRVLDTRMNRLVYCYLHKEDLNEAVLQEWIGRLCPADQVSAQVAQNLIVSFTKICVASNKVQTLRKFLKQVVNKKEVIDKQVWKRVRQILIESNMLAPLLDFEAYLVLEPRIRKVARCLEILKEEGSSIVSDWARKADHSPMIILDLILTLIVYVKSQETKASLIINLLSLKFLEKLCFNEIDDSEFWDLVVVFTNAKSEVRKIFIQELINLQAWKEARRLLGSRKDPLSLQYLEKISIAEAIYLSNNETSISTQVANQVKVVENPDDEELLAYLDGTLKLDDESCSQFSVSCEPSFGVL